MGKKSKAGNKKKQTKEDKEVLPEVDKEFYELQITSLNQKLSRLRSHCSELELENDEIKKSLRRLDDNRADIIAYLKRTLQAKADEISELQERLTALQQTRKDDEEIFLEKMNKLKHEFKTVNEQLNSEIKLLNGKLNSLEEFRRERDDLMNKFAEQEQAMKELTNMHEVSLYELEKKFIVGKDELKKDLENKLLQLSLDFQNTTDIRIATTTGRVIRENISISNEINVLTESWNNVLKEKLDTKKQEKQLNGIADIQRELNKALLKKNAVQLKIIEKISAIQRKMQDSLKKLNRVRQHEMILEEQLDVALSKLGKSEDECRKLRQTLDSRLAEESQREEDIKELIQRCYGLQRIVTTAAQTVSQVLKVQVIPNVDEAYSLIQRESLLVSLLDLCYGVDCDKFQLPTVKLLTARISLRDTSLAYSAGDLGLVSKTKIKLPD